MGGNKPFREAGGKTLLAHVIEVARAQCDHVMISSNEDMALFAQYDLPVVADQPRAGQGPLGGILGAFDALPDGIDWLATFPVDCPVIPDDMVRRLLTAAEAAGTRAAFASHAGRDHYLSALWHRDAAAVIRDQLLTDNRRVRGPLQMLDAARVVFASGQGPLEPFANINSEDDLNRLDAQLSTSAGPRRG